jgi:uncharacterized protein (TIGR00725 family)
MVELSRKPRIGVMGPSECTGPVRDLAREVGRHIAVAGAILVCGGKGGAMEAAAQGAREAGGLTIGILPGTDPYDANPYVDIPVVTGLGEARNWVNVLTSQAVIAVHGGVGTLSEIALALRAQRPVVLLRSWSITSPDGEVPHGIVYAETAEDAVQKALALLAR